MVTLELPEEEDEDEYIVSILESGCTIVDDDELE